MLKPKSFYDLTPQQLQTEKGLNRDVQSSRFISSKYFCHGVFHHKYCKIHLYTLLEKQELNFKYVFN